MRLSTRSTWPAMREPARRATAGGPRATPAGTPGRHRPLVRPDDGAAGVDEVEGALRNRAASRDRHWPMPWRRFSRRRMTCAASSPTMATSISPRVRFPNPFVTGIRFSLATGLHVVPAHDCRHLSQAWRARRAAEQAETDAARPSMIAGGRTLAARRAGRPAFAGRAPPGGVAPPSNTSGILGRRAWPAGRIGRLGATAGLDGGSRSMHRMPPRATPKPRTKS